MPKNFELSEDNANRQRGWVCKHPHFGVWFLAFDAVKADYVEALKDMDGDDAEPDPKDGDVLSWWSEQCGWPEVSRLGKQLERPDMAAVEKSFYEQMKSNSEVVDASHGLHAAGNFSQAH